MKKMSRKDFVRLCNTAQYPVKRIGELPIEMRTACIELAKKSAIRKGKLIHEVLPFVMNIRGTSGEVELTVLIENESEIL